MKAFIVTVIVPNEWQSSDVLTALNWGIKETADNQENLKPANALCWSVQIRDEFDLKRQDI